MTCGALILAAGASKRLGQPKQLIRLAGETLLDRTVRTAKEADCAPVVVVLGAFEEQIRKLCELQQVVLVSNPDWAEGMGTSLAIGIGAFERVTGVVVMTCDMPAVTQGHLRALAASSVLTASSYAGRNGVPAYFPRAAFEVLAAIRGDSGARTLLRTAPAIDLPGGELDLDTADDLKLILKMFIRTD